MNQTAAEADEKSSKAVRGLLEPSKGAVSGSASPGKPPPTRIPDHVVLDRDGFFEYLSKAAADIVDQRIKWREARWHALLVGVAAIMGFLGFTSVDRLVEDVRRQATKIANDHSVERIRLWSDLQKEIDVAVTNKVDEHIGSLKSELTAKTGLLDLSRLADTIDSATSFSNRDRDSIMEACRQISTLQKDEFGEHIVQILEKIIRSFAAADLKTYLDELDGLFGELLGGAKEVSIILTEHYGMRLAGDPREPGQWEKETITRFRRYAAAATRNKYPEAALPYELLVEFRRNGQVRSVTLEQMLDAGNYWTPEERASFIAAVISRTNPRFHQRIKTKLGDTVATLASEFVSEFRDELHKLMVDDGVSKRLKEIAQTRPPNQADFADAILMELERATGDSTVDAEP